MISIKLTKYYRNLFCIYFVLFITATTIISYSLIGYMNYKNTQDAFVDNTIQFEKFTSETEVIFNTLDLIVNHISDYDIAYEYARESALSYTEINFERILKLSKILQKVQTNFSTYNIRIYMTKPNDNIVITGQGTTVSYEDILSENGINVSGAISLLGDESKKGIYYEIIPQEKVSNRVEVICRKVFDEGASVYFLLTFERDNMKCEYDKRTDKNYIYSNYMEKYSADIKNEIANGNLTELRYVKLPKKDIYLFFNQDTTRQDIVYVKVFHEAEKNNRKLIACLCIAIGLSIFLALLFTKISYLPIKRLLKKLGLNFAESSDEFAVIEKKIHSITELNKKEYSIFEMLNGFVWEEKMRSLAKEIGIDFIMDECWILMVKVENMFSEYDYEAWGTVSAENPVIEALKSKFDEYENAVSFKMFRNQLILICSSESNSEDTIISDIDSIRYVSDGRIIVAVTSVTGGNPGLSKAYRLLSNGLNIKALTDSREIITAEDIIAASESKLVYSSDTEQKLIDYCVCGQKIKATYYLKNIFEANNFLEHDAFETFKYAMVITVKRILSNLDADEIRVFGSKVSIMSEITEMENLESMFESVKDMIEIITDYVNENSNKNNENLIDKIMKYIDENLSKDISVTDISKEFGISPSYIGKIFRGNYNTSFKAYIDRARIEKAKQILDGNKNILIKDLALSLGYNNVSSFIRMFKKSEGVSPGQYMKEE